MDLFCFIALRDWFINLCDRILRAAAGERALDHYWPCGTCVSPPTRRFVTSLGKCLQGGCGTYNEPRPLDSPVLFVYIFLTVSYQFVVGEETPVQKCWYWRPTRMQLPINQPVRESTQLKLRLDYPCFQVSNRGVYFHLSNLLMVTLFHLGNYFSLGLTSLDQKALKYRLDYPCFQVSNRGVYFHLS